MHHYERAPEAPAEGAPPVHSHASLINEPAPSWRDPKDRALATMNFAVVDSLRSLRGASSPALTSFLSTGVPVAASPSFPSSSRPRVQLSRTENDYTVSPDQCSDSFSTGRLEAQVQHHQHAPTQRFPSSSSASSSDSFARPLKQDVRSRAALQRRLEQHNLTRRGRQSMDYDETESDESNSSSIAGHERALLRTNSSRRGAGGAFPLYHAEQAFASALPAAPLPSLSVLPAPVSAAAIQHQEADSSRQSTQKPAVRGRRKGLTPEEKRKARTCVVDGCSNYIVHRHRCFRHGGGKRCSVDGCNTSAKQRGLCWRHGGSIICKIDGCTRGVKSKGLCWSHGEGKKLQEDAEGADTVYYCLFDDCYNAPVVNAFCEVHSREVTQPGYVYEL